MQEKSKENLLNRLKKGKPKKTIEISLNSLTQKKLQNIKKKIRERRDNVTVMSKITES